jgi:hypothetical protein
VTGELLKMKRLPAIKAVVDALGVNMSDPCLKAAGFDLPSLKAAGFDTAAFRAAGFSWSDLKAAGFTSSEVKAAGCDLPSLKAAGFDLPSLKAAGFDAAACRAAGNDLPSLKAAGFTSSDCKAAGFDPKSLQSAGYDVPSLIIDFGYDAVASSGCDVSSVVLVLPPYPAKCTARADNRSASAGPQILDLTPCNPRSPARRRQPLRDAAYAPS